MYRVLICDDEKDIVSALEIYLRADGYETLSAGNGAEALDILSREEIHLVLMDIMMPKMDGLTAVSRLREEYNVPVILLTAKGEDTDKVLGLNIGADDYVTKPFDAKELVARVKAVLRRTQGPEEEKSDSLSFPGLTVSLSRYEVFYEGEKVEMPPKELEVLYFLASHPNQLFTRGQLLDRVWGYDIEVESRTVDVHVKRLRDKLPECEKHGWGITTIWRRGYKFEVK